MEPSDEYPVLDFEQVARSLPQPQSTPKPLGSRRVLVVLDDDPTGTQTVHGIDVLTTWDRAVITKQLQTGDTGFFILTNSRAYGSSEASSLIKTVLTNLRDAAAEVDPSLPIDILLRSDSTLRGHFPLEPQIAEEIFGPFDAWLLAPAFPEGGRVTVSDVHYVREDNSLVPASQTPFAQDTAFGFKSSNLRDWIREKYKGKDVPRVESISIEELRDNGAAEKIAARLEKMKSRDESRPVIVVLNAFERSDMDTFVAAVAMTKQMTFVYRSGATFVAAHLMIAKKPPIPPDELFTRSHSSGRTGGLIVIGSHVPKTTAQRKHLLERCKAHILHLEIDVEQLVERQGSIQDIVDENAQEIDRGLAEGIDVVLSTSRKLITEGPGEANLGIGRAVSNTIVDIVKSLKQQPKYIIAKGGITSSDIATKAMGLDRAIILGQAATGVPVWLDDTDSKRWASVPYIVFPGNVGGEQALGELVATYRRQP